MIAPRKSAIALALSGGGVRAMVFHLGVLRLLAERNLLEDVRRVSTVSGGSLLVGLMLQEAGLLWPTSEQFLFLVYPTLRSKLCERSMQWGAARQLLKPWNLRFLLSRANLLALTLKHEWGVTAKLAQMPAKPEWSVNGTTAENGKRFRFKYDSIGDYTLGYASPDDFLLADALAVSAAFPGGFGPLTLDTTRFNWHKRSSWGAPPETAQPVNIGFKRIRLYDGGVYDNLGLEPFFDAGRSIPKIPGEAIIVSDAGAPLQTGFSPFALSPWRAKRVADIMADQARSLRVRTFSHYLQQASGRGAYLYIGTSVSDGTPCASATFASRFPTTLRRVNSSEFDALADHGYRVTLRAESEFGLTGVPKAIDEAHEQ